MVRTGGTLAARSVSGASALAAAFSLNLALPTQRYQRRAAAAIFASPPTSTFEECLEHFEAAEKSASHLILRFSFLRGLLPLFSFFPSVRFHQHATHPLLLSQLIPAFTQRTPSTLATRSSSWAARTRDARGWSAVCRYLPSWPTTAKPTTKRRSCSSRCSFSFSLGCCPFLHATRSDAPSTQPLAVPALHSVAMTVRRNKK